jgi:hypothetical protein
MTEPSLSVRPFDQLSVDGQYTGTPTDTDTAAPGRSGEPASAKLLCQPRGRVETIPTAASATDSQEPSSRLSMRIVAVKTFSTSFKAGPAGGRLRRPYSRRQRPTL